MNKPVSYINLRVNPKQEHEILGRYVGKDGSVSEQDYLVAGTYGPPAARRRTAVQIALGPQLIEALKSEHEAASQAIEFQCGKGCETCELINQYEGA